MNPEIKFESEQFNRIFPFYILVDRQMLIKSYGKTLEKIFPGLAGQYFYDHFLVQRPAVESSDFTSLQGIFNQLIIIECRNPRKTILRGQLEYLASEDQVLFIGSPWFGSMELVIEYNLRIDDFAYHDPIIDLLHVLKTQEIANDELKKFLNTINKQKNDLKAAAKEIHDIALFPMQNPDPLIRIDLEGNILKLNPAAEAFTEFLYNDIQYSVPDFWKEIAKKIKPESDREIIEAQSGNRWFSFVIKPLPKDGYFNIYGRDITNEKYNEDQLLILSSIAAQNTHGVVIADKNGRIEWVNNSYEKMTGYTIEEIKGKKPGHFLQGADTSLETLSYLKTQIFKGEPFVCEILNYHKSGMPFWIRIQGQALKDKSNKVIKYFAIEEDITDEKATQKKLLEFESRFRIALDKVGDNVWEHEFGSGRTIFSSTQNQFLGYSFDEVENIDRFWWDHVYTEDLVILTENDKKIKNKEIDHYSLEYRVYHKDGSLKWVLDRGVVIEKGEDGRPLKLIGTHTDISRQKNVELVLKIKEEKYRNIIANINLGLIEYDMDERIQYANQRFCIMSGFTLDELIGKDILEIVYSDLDKNSLQNRYSHKSEGITDTFELSLTTKNGEKKWWLISVAPNYNDSGAIIGYIAIHLDITEQKKLENDLTLAKNNAEASSKFKELFLANMSHEIRTPLNAVIGLIRDLSRERLSKTQEVYIRNAELAGQHLLSIVNNILDITKIESGQMSLDIRPFNLIETIQDIISILFIQAREKMIEIRTDISKDLAPTYSGDANRIRQILLNILNNAIKFTEKGFVEIKCQLEGVDNGYHVLHFTFTDSGIGMDESYVNNIFDKFSQGDISTARKYGGTGLGMAITYELVHLMNGEISVSSKKDVGTIVDIMLSLEISDEIVTRSLSATEGLKTLRNKSILLVEDSDLNRMVAINSLTYYGMKVTEAVNGLDALEKLKNSNFDLILLDLQMPVMGGIEAATRIRGDMDLKIPIIALTANAFKAEIDRCLEAGMDDYVIKPYDEKTLMDVISKHLNASRARKEAQALNLKNDMPLFNLDYLNQLSRGNNEFTRKMIDIFIGQVPAEVEEISNAYKVRDLDTVRRLAHKLKPNIDNFGITDLKQDIRDIEAMAGEGKVGKELEQKIIRLQEVIKRVIEQMSNA